MYIRIYVYIHIHIHIHIYIYIYVLSKLAARPSRSRRNTFNKQETQHSTKHLGVCFLKPFSGFGLRF